MHSPRKDPPHLRKRSVVSPYKDGHFLHVPLDNFHPSAQAVQTDPDFRHSQVSPTQDPKQRQ